MRHASMLLAAVLLLAAAAQDTAPADRGSISSGSVVTDRGRPIDLRFRMQTTLHVAAARKRTKVEAVDDDYANTAVKIDLAPGCTTHAGCPSQFVTEALQAQRSPGLTGQPFTVNGGGDPQIAVGKSFAVVTSYNSIWVYGKSGQSATADAEGNSLAYPITAEQLFAPLLEDVNKNLNLPKNLPCDPKNPHANGSWCVADIYDLRVIHDDFRDRFWIFAAGRNWRNPGISFDNPANRVGLRAKAFLAVSETGDPRGGYYLYTFDDVIDAGACNDATDPPTTCGPAKTYQPGDGADYPSLGISKDYFVQTINVGNANPVTNKPGHFYTLVNVFDAAKLASGGCSTPCSFSYWNITYPGTDQVVAGTIQPAVQHDVPPGGWTLMTQVAYPKWAIRFAVLRAE